MNCLQVSEEEASMICQGRHEDQLLKSYLLSEIKAGDDRKGPKTKAKRGC